MENTNSEVLYQIETGIPVPVQNRGKGLTAAIRRLRVGESVVLPTNGGYGLTAPLVRAGEGKFVCRKIGDKRTRIWRIPDTAA